MHRVVITGIGAITPFGVGMDHCYRQLVQGNCSIKQLLSPEFERCKCRIGAVVPRGSDKYEYDPAKYRVTDKSTQPNVIGYAIASSHEALKAALINARLDVCPDYYAKEDVGVYLSTGIGNINEIDKSSSLLSNGKRLSPFFVPRILNNLPASNISIRFGFKGPSVSNNMACASSAYSILEAFHSLQRGDCSLALAGGSESCIGHLAYQGFEAMHALAVQFNDTPGQSSRPFDKSRHGFVMGEGSVVLILEKLETAIERQATIIISIESD